MVQLDAAHLPVRIIQLLFAIIVLGLSADLIYRGNRYNYYNDGFGNEYVDTFYDRSWGFDLFTAVWTFLVLLYFIPAHTIAHGIHHPIVAAALDFLTMIFWFAAFIAMAVSADQWKNSAYFGDFYNNNYSYIGGYSTIRVMQAAAVFSAFEWLLFVFTCILSTFGILHRRGHQKNSAVVQPGV